VGKDEADRNVHIELVFSQEVERLQRIAVGMGLSAEQGQDMLQDVYLKILDRPPGFRDPQDAARWLMRVTVNQCLTEHRRRVRRGRRLRDVFYHRSERNKAQVGPDQQMVRTEEMEAVREGLEQLGELLRAPLVLKYYCGLNATEIGEVLRLKPPTVRKRLSEGRIALANVLLQRGIRP